jgi:CheY-like chemotaxis protein
MELLLSDVWRPDVILSDIEMPKMDGWEFLECVKNTDATSTIPVVMVTSLDADEHRHRAFLLGASDYNVKPISSERIVRVMNGISSRKANGSAAGSA